MSGLDTINIIAAVITIASFVFAIWITFRSDMKIKELRETISTIDNIAGTAIWEYHIAPARDYELRLRQAEKILAFMTSIRKMTERYSKAPATTFDSCVNSLINHDILWTVSRLYDYEISKKVTEVWVISKDLKPDSIDEELGKLINRNLRNGTKYKYFYSEGLDHKDKEKLRLLKNLNSNDKRVKGRVSTIQIPKENENVFVDGNIALYFFDESRNLQPRCFQEILFSKLNERGAFWQEVSAERAIQLKYFLDSLIEAPEILLMNRRSYDQQ